MPSLKLSNPFRRADGRPSLKERAAALKASAARAIRRPKPVEAAPVVDWNSPPAGFVAYPAHAPFGFTHVTGVIHAEASKLLDIALGEYKRRCDLMGSDLGEEERSERRKAIRAALRLDALAAATDAGADYPALSEAAIEAGAQRLEEVGESSLSYTAEQASRARASWLQPIRLPSGEMRVVDIDAAVARAAAWKPSDERDAELLALGRQFDEAHAIVLSLEPAQNEAHARVSAFWKQHQGRPGWTTERIQDAAWKLPGASEAEEAHELAQIRLDEIQKQIISAVASTPAGLAVKARAVIPAIWAGSPFEDGAALGEAEDWDERNIRSLINDCLSLGGVDWKGHVVAGVAGPLATEDAELLDLGRQFQASFKQELEACARVNAIQTAANELLPDRPDSLYFRASDEPFCLHSEGRGFQDDGAIRQADIEWMTRRPSQREVWRDVRDGERGWDMVPGKVPEMQLWPEAQARVDEIVAAWSAYQAEIQRVQAESGADEANEIANRVGEQSESLALRIAALPASTAEGMRVKLRVLHRYAPLREREDLEDPETPVLRSLFRDAGV